MIDGGSGRVDLNPPSEVARIARVLEDAGYETWAVGGAVRDALIGLHPMDWDLTTSARPPEVRRLFRRTVPIGIEHGTVGVIGRDGRMLEVTTFRRDVETFGRKARVVFSDSLEEDLQRRDFTINAVAWHPTTWHVSDPHGGMTDLRSGILRTVGAAEDRFEEDRLRVLRALRFAGRFELEIDPATWNAVLGYANKLDRLSPERVREELWKVLSGREPSRALHLYRTSGVLNSLFPELASISEADDGRRWKEVLEVVDSVPETRPVLRMAALLHRSAGDVAGGDEAGEHSGLLAHGLMKRLRASNAEIDRVTHVISQLSTMPVDAGDPSVLRWIRMVGREYLNDIFRLRIAIVRVSGAAPGGLVESWRRVRQLVRSGTPLSVTELPVDGSDLRKAGLKPGPIYGDILSELLEMVTEDPGLNNRPALLALLNHQVEARSDHQQ